MDFLNPHIRNDWHAVSQQPLARVVDSGELIGMERVYSVFLLYPSMSGSGPQFGFANTKARTG